MYVADPPSEPRDLVIDKYDKSSVTLKWKTPISDGGNAIKGYQVQVLPVRGTGDWRPINAKPCAGTEFVVPNLIEDADYEFRVVAVNDGGPGKPSKSTGPHRVRDPICECWDARYTRTHHEHALCCILR